MMMVVVVREQIQVMDAKACLVQCVFYKGDDVVRDQYSFRSQILRLTLCNVCNMLSKEMMMMMRDQIQVMDAKAYPVQCVVYRCRERPIFIHRYLG